VGLDHLHASTVSVPEQVRILSARLQEQGSATFADLVADCEHGIEVVGRFLAVLEMYRAKDVALDQPEAFAELHVRWAPGGDAGSAGLTGEDE
jgi:segregation and condensation protein A